MKLSDLGEKGIVKRLRGFLDIGDDAAYMRFGKEFLILTTDAIYEKTHILPGMSWEQIGKLIVTVNLSDIAAMGAKPFAFLLSCGVPDVEFKDFEGMIRAVDNQCKRYETKFAGGDTKHMDKLTLCGTAIGRTKKPVLRSGAGVGDIVAVTGELGDAALGTEILLKKSKFKNKFSKKIRKALEPEPRIKEGIVLGNYATSMTDISDSLSMSLHDIAESSNAGIIIDIDKLPVSVDSGKAAKNMNQNIMDYALYGGGDYELLFTMPEKYFSRIKDVIDITKIGRVIKGSGVVGIDGKKEFSIGRRGYEHFSKFQ